jgi:hypothetical protein
VNKAADYYMKAEEVLPLPGPPRSVSPKEPDAPPPPAVQRRPPKATNRSKSTLAKLRQLEAELDVALEAVYQRFCRSEITAKEMDRQRDELIRAFNRGVMSENIRYRGMLRSRPSAHH